MKGMLTTKQKLDILRRRWMNEPQNRERIENRASLLKMAEEEKSKGFIRDAEKIFGASAK